MPTLIAAADGNWTANTSWKVAESGSGAIQATRSASTNTTASYVWSAAFTCTNADVLIGVVLHCARVNTTGTVTIALSDDGGVTATREVTINASDIPPQDAGAGTMVYFKFGTSLTADGGADYRVGVKGSSAGNAAFWRSATAGDWFHVVATNANPVGAPAAADNIFVCGEWTGAGAVTSRSVTMDSTDSTDHGAIDIGDHGTVSFGTAASTNYVLKLSGDLVMWSGGTLNIGTVATPIPATSTAKVVVDCVTNGQWGVWTIGGTFVAQGASRAYTWTYLNANAAVNATSITTADSTGWKSGDKIAIATTTRNRVECEAGTLSGDASGTTLNITGFGGVGGGLAYAHSGTNPTRAEIINLTRNVQIVGVSDAVCTFLYVSTLAVVDWDWVELHWIGTGSAQKRGVDIATTTGSFNMNGCSMHDLTGGQTIGLYITGTASGGTVSVDNVVGWRSSAAFIQVAAAVTNYSLTNLVFIRNGDYSYSAIYLGSNAGTLQHVNVSGSYSGGVSVAGGNVTGLIDDINTHGNWPGLYLQGEIGHGSKITNLKTWRNNSTGISQDTNAPLRHITFDTVESFGNQNGTIIFGTAGVGVGVVFRNFTCNGDTSFSSPCAINFWTRTAGHWPLLIENSQFGVATGIKTAHTGGDIVFQNTLCDVGVVCRNVTFGTGSPQNAWDNSIRGSYLKCQKYGQVSGDHRTFISLGPDTAVIQTDSVIYKTATPSERITPASTSVKVQSGAARKTVNNGATVTFSVWVRKSKVDDPTIGDVSYNGNNPRLILKANPALGIDTDVVLDTLTEAVGTWHQLTGTSAAVNDDGVLEACVDCDGTAGWINVDDWT